MGDEEEFTGKEVSIVAKLPFWRSNFFYKMVVKWALMPLLIYWGWNIGVSDIIHVPDMTIDDAFFFLLFLRAIRSEFDRWFIRG